MMGCQQTLTTKRIWLSLVKCSVTECECDKSEQVWWTDVEDETSTSETGKHVQYVQCAVYIVCTVYSTCKWTE